MKLKSIICCLLVFCMSWQARASETIDFETTLLNQGIQPNRAAILIQRLEDGVVWSHGEDRIDKRFVAASTSKIPHTFIAIEEGYVDSANARFEWDGQERFAASWNQDQTMATAYTRSAVWVFQQITEALGPETMAAGIDRLDYGNEDTGGPEDITSYWLNGPLKISAREQVEFLTRLYQEDLPLSAKSYVLGKEIMGSGRDDGRHAKTGWYYSNEAQDIGWYVGWQEVPASDDQDSQTYVFNIHVKCEDVCLA
ncbi:MAG: penicillin-binding transpeptidase domain-containing protein, partial [Pseudomonadota bacterium]